MSLTTGTRVARYEIRAPLGAGGMGEVYRAHDPDLERDVAIKILRDRGAGSDRVRRFVQEAKAASSLNHPNVAHVYEIGTHDDFRFIAMELVEGETLRDRLARGPLGIDDTLAIGTQIAAGLAAAHRAGIVHRDVKPENVMIRPDGYAKILDFGLAKLREVVSDDAATLLKTAPGITMGTLSYMAPEQLRGGDVTAAADVFSLGVVLYEMIGGHRPFLGADATQVVAAILAAPPQPLHELRRDVPSKLESIVTKSLAKTAEERYQSAGEVVEALGQISREAMAAAVSGDRPAAPRVPAILLRTGAALLVIALIAGATWMLIRSTRQKDAAAKVAIAERHLGNRAFPEAYEAAMAAAAILPGDERLRDVIARSSEKATFESDPPGAAVFLQRLHGPAERTRIGTTPLVIPRLAYGGYVVTMEKEGYAPALRPLTTTPLFLADVQAPSRPAEVKVKLVETSVLPPGMILVEGGQYSLAGWSRPSDRAVHLDDFFLDRFEVSNRDFEEFVRAGGYRRRELWKHPFVDGGKTLSFEEAMARFQDTTSLPGPRNWSRGAPPAGSEQHPVTDVTWYEAAAFAEWKGKKLPTIYQWEIAARSRTGGVPATLLPWGYVVSGNDISDRANFLGNGTMPVDSMPFGISPWAAYHMAGNVSEWCRNPKQPGYAVRGGAWNDAIYAFGATGSFPAFYASSTLGFRCVKELAGGAGDQGGFEIAAVEQVPTYEPVGDEEFEHIRQRYDYVKEPLQAKVVETIETADWKREKITFVVAGKLVPAYLYVPKGFRPPFQVINFSPGSGVTGGFGTLDFFMEFWTGPAIRSGRAVFSVIREGYIGRPRAANFARPDMRSPEFADYAVGEVTELRRGLDYLETRKDLDSSRIAFLGISAGTVEGLLLAGLEQRYRSVMLLGTSVRRTETTVTPAANRINFAPRISGQKLMLHGRYDESAPLKTQGEPLFQLLSEPKRLEVYDGGHAPPFDIYIPVTQKWLDETLGPVQ